MVKSIIKFCIFETSSQILLIFYFKMINFIYLILSKVLFAEKLKNKSNLASNSISIPFYENYTILENLDLKKRVIDNIRSGYKHSFIHPLSGCRKAKECKPKIQDKCQKIFPSIEDHDNSLKILNFIRELAGLPKNIIEDEQWSEQCYKLAQNLQKIGKIPLNHLVTKEYATDQFCGDESNIQFINSSKLLITENSMNVFNSLLNYINSEKVENKILLLDPNYIKVGFGFYPFSKEKINGLISIKPSITVIKISDKPFTVNSVNDKTNLNFISWPPEGPFPIEFLQSNWFIRQQDFRQTKISQIKISIKFDDDELEIKKSTNNGDNEDELKVEKSTINDDNGDELEIKKAKINDDNDFDDELKVEKATINDDVLVLKISKEGLDKCEEMKTIIVTVINQHTQKIYRFSFKLFKADQRRYFHFYTTEKTQHKLHTLSGIQNSKDNKRQSNDDINYAILNVLTIIVTTILIFSIIIMFLGVGDNKDASENEDIEEKNDNGAENNGVNNGAKKRDDNTVDPVDSTSCCYCGVGCGFVCCTCCSHDWNCDDCDFNCDDCSFCDLCGALC